MNLKDSNDSREKGTHTQESITQFQSPHPELQPTAKEGLSMDTLGGGSRWSVKVVHLWSGAKFYSDGSAVCNM